jgi:hypothetical protein
LVLLVPLAAVVGALALIPTAALGDHICSPGHPKNSTYCMTVCVVPKVVGRHLKKAELAIVAHDCKVGKIRKRDRDKNCEKGKPKCTTAAAKSARKREHGFEKGIVVKQKPAAGAGSNCLPGVGPASQCLPTNTKVNLTVEF